MSAPTLQTLHLSHLPASLAVHVALYTDLHNASFLHDQLLQGNSEFEYALIDASVLLSTTHVSAAIFRAAHDYLNGRLKSRNVHSEIVFSLGATNNIAQTLRNFGISASTTTLLAIKLSTEPHITHDSVSSHLAAHVQGTAVEFDNETLAGMTDVAKVRKLYKLAGVGEGGSSKRRRKEGSEEGIGVPQGDVASERRELEVAVLGLMALRGAM